MNNGGAKPNEQQDDGPTDTALTAILRHYAQPGVLVDPNAVAAHFDEVTQAIPVAEVGHGVAQAFKSDRTPPFGHMIAQLFGHSNPQQRASVLSQLLSSVTPGMLRGLGGGKFANMFSHDPAGPAEVSASQAAEVTPAQVEEVATQAEHHDPSVVDRIGKFYAAHPHLMETLGSAAMAIVLAAIAGRRQSQES